MPASAVRRRGQQPSLPSSDTTSSGLSWRRSVSNTKSTGNRRSSIRAAIASRRPDVLLLLLGVMSPLYLSNRHWAANAADSISVVTPEALEAGEAFAVLWDFATDLPNRTTGDLNPFEIELRSCGLNGEGCSLDECGTSYRALCEREGGCMDSDGSYDVVVPEDITEGDYVISVSYMGAAGWASASSSISYMAEVSACSGMFFVGGSPSTSASSAEGIPSLEAISPQGELEPGQAFTAEWAYDDGQGQGDGLFEINLYSCADNACADGSCGVFAEALCAAPGCYDPGPGDYDVRVPASTSPGQFKLQVKTSESPATSACTSAAFDVVSADENYSSVGSGDNVTPTPAPTTSRTTAAPVPPPTAEPAARVADPSTPQPIAPPTAPPSPAPVPPTLAPTARTSAPVATPTRAPFDARTPGPTAVPNPPAAEAASSSTGQGSPGTPPSPVPPRNTCSAAAVVSYSYEIETSTGMPLVTISHESGERDEGGCASLTGMWEWLATGPDGVPTDLLYPADPNTGVPNTGDGAAATGTWLLRTSVDVTNGVLFEVKGTVADDGDCDKLLLSSSPELYIRLRGAGGHLYIYETHITSWSESLLTQHELSTDDSGDVDGSTPRSFVGCVSEILEAGQTCSGVAKQERGECRMDIISSELGYLGYDATESYGITWKVRGLCDDLSNVDSLFESVRVYGDLQDSDIHHMWYGMYSYGHLGGVWTNNFMHDNHVYGFDPHDDSDYLTIQGNSCYNNGNHGIIASKRCDHLLVKENISFDNLGSGIMLHQSCDDSIVIGNEVYSNFDAGLSLVETSRTVVTGNGFNGNKWGVRVLVGSNDNVVEDNSFDTNTQHDIYQYIGSSSDVPKVSPFTGINERNTYINNIVVASAKYTVDLEDSSETIFNKNQFIGSSAFSFIRTDETRLYENSGAATNAEPYVEDSCFTTDSGVLPVCS